MNTEDFVTYEQAVRLKELGFDWKVNHYYNSGKDLCENLADYSDEDIANGEDTSYEDFNTHKILGIVCSAPTLAQAAKWLREKHNLFVEVYVDYPTVNSSAWAYDLREIGRNYLWSSNEINFNSYEKALSAGIDTALKLIN